MVLLICWPVSKNVFCLIAVKIYQYQVQKLLAYFLCNWAHSLQSNVPLIMHK